jgi:hypothetical protein
MSESLFHRGSEGIERVKDILSTIQVTADNFPADPEKQAMYIQGLTLWTEDLQEAIQELGTTPTTTIK